MNRRNISLFILNASGRLSPYVKDIERVFNDSIDKISNRIVISNIDIIVRDNPQHAISELGVGGWTIDYNFVSISLVPKFPNFLDKVINNNLEGTFAHELNHAARWQTVGYGTTLFEALISEGLADHFEIEITSKKPSLWDTALSKKQIEIFSEKARKEYHDKKFNHDEWFFGSKEKGIPRWTGYSLGYNLVAEYLKNNPDKKPSQLYNLKAEEFVK